MAEIKKNERGSKLQTKKQQVSDNDSEYSSYDEKESVDESPVRTRPQSKTKVKTEQTDDIEPQDATRRGRRGKSTRSRRTRSRSRSQSRRGGRRSSRTRRR